MQSKRSENMHSQRDVVHIYRNEGEVFWLWRTVRGRGWSLNLQMVHFLYPKHSMYSIVSGQIIIFHQPLQCRACETLRIPGNWCVPRISNYFTNLDFPEIRRFPFLSYILEVKIACVRLRWNLTKYYIISTSIWVVFFRGKSVNEPLSHLGYHGCFHRNPWEPRYASYIILWPHESPTKKITGKTLPA